MSYSKRTTVLTTTLSLAVAGIMLASPSYATSLKTADLNSPGDNLLTVDNNADLEFLDVDATQGLSYNEIQQTNFVKRDGFRLATTSQLSQLFTDAGIPNLTGNFDEANDPAIDKLVHKFIGSTVTAHPFTLPIPAFKAQIGDGNYGFSLASGAPSGRVNVAGLDYQSASGSPTGQERGRVIFNLTSFPKDMAGPAPGDNTKSIVGAYLVRSTNAQAVPEPSSLGLMGFGLLMIAGMGFYTGRKHHGHNPAERCRIPNT